jgi:hypothetical protein
MRVAEKPPRKTSAVEKINDLKLQRYSLWSLINAIKDCASDEITYPIPAPVGQG